MNAAIKSWSIQQALVATLGALTLANACAQTSPAQGNLASADDMPLADYLGLLRQIAPAAEDGAKAYLAAFRQRCGRTVSTAELRRAISDGQGDPVLMGLIRASQLRDAHAREQWLARLRCPVGDLR